MGIQILPAEPKGGLASFLTGAGQGLGEGLQTGIKQFFEQKKEKQQAGQLASFLGLNEDESKTFTFLTPQQQQLAINVKLQEKKGIQQELRDQTRRQEKITDFNQKQSIKANEQREKLLRSNREKAARFIQQEDKKRNFPDPDGIRDNALKLVDQGADPFEAVSAAIRDSETPDTFEQASAKPLSDTTEQGSISKGVRASIAGRATAIANGVPFSKFEKSIAIENPTLLDTLGFSGARLAANAPFFGAGATLGAAAGTTVGGPIGAVVGGGAGAFGLEALLDNTLREFHEFKEKGGNGGLEEFIERAGRVAKETGESAILGGSLSALSRAVPVLKTIPALKPLFAKGGKAAEIGTAVAAETGGLLALETARRGQLPSKQDAAATLLTVLGFKAAGQAGKFKERVVDKVRKSGQPLEATAERIKTEVDRAGIDIEKVNAGDAKEQIKFDRIVRNVTKEAAGEKPARVARETKKEPFRKTITPEEKVAERKVEQKLVRKAAKSPLEVFEKAEVAADEKAARLAEKPEFIEGVNRRIELVDTKIKEQNQKIFALESQRRAVKASEKSILTERIENARTEKLETEQRLRDLEFEKRFGKERPTERSINAQIKKSFDKLATEIREGVEVDPKKIARTAALDKVAIDRATALLKRGKLLSEPEVDTFLNIKKQYAKAYKAMVEANKPLIELGKDAPKGSEAFKEGQNAAKMNERLEKRLKRAEADIVQQADKKQIQKLTKGAKGAFFRNKLKNLRSDVESLQKEVFTHEKIRNKIQQKVEKAALSNIKEAQSQTQKTFEKPTIENIEVLSKQTGVSKEKWQDTIKSVGDKFNQAGKDIGKGSSGLNAIGKASNVIMKVLKPLPLPEKLKKAIATGIIFWGIQEISEAATGFRPPGTLIALVSPGGAIGRLGAATIASLIKRGVTKVIETREVDAFKKVLQTNNTPKIRAHERTLRNKGVAESKITRLRNKARAA